MHSSSKPSWKTSKAGKKTPAPSKDRRIITAKPRAWVDPEDEGASREEENRKRYAAVNGSNPSWANPKKKKSDHDSGDEDDEDTISTEPSDALRSGELPVTKVLNLNATRKEADFIRSVDFHPHQPVALVASMKMEINFYKVDGQDNSHVQTCYIKGPPIQQALFSADGEEFYVNSGKSNYFWTCNSLTGGITKTIPDHETQNECVRKLVVSPDNRIIVHVGKNGNVYLIARRSKEVISNFTVNGEIRDVVFNDTGSLMYGLADGGEIYQWKMSTRSIVGKIIDNGALSGTRLAVSGHHIATGCTSGVVNIYDANSFTAEPTKVTPIKTFMNLTTKITDLKFNHTGQLLAMASNEKPNAIRMADMNSMTVYSNFPFVDSIWKRPNTIAFSPNSGYFSFGNNTGSAHLFRINHFHAY